MGFLNRLAIDIERRIEEVDFSVGTFTSFFVTDRDEFSRESLAIEPVRGRFRSIPIKGAPEIPSEQEQSNGSAKQKLASIVYCNYERSPTILQFDNIGCLERNVTKKPQNKFHL